MSEAARCAASSVISMLGMNISDQDLLRMIAWEGEFMVSAVVDVAKSLMIVDRRNQLTVRDVNEALAVQKREPLYGYARQRKIDTKVVKFNKNVELVVVRDAKHPADHFTDLERYQYPLQVRFACDWVVQGGKSGEVDEAVTEESPEKQNIECGKLRAYFERTIEMFEEGGVNYQVALGRMSRSLGIGSLLPNYVEFAMKRLTTQQDDMDVVRKTVRLLRAIVANDAFNLLMKLEDVVGTVLTVLVRPRLNSCGDSDLREEAGELVGFLCQKYSSVIPTLRSSLAKELISVLFDEATDGYGMYGALVALSFLGYQVARCLLLPELERLSEWIGARNLPAWEQELVCDALFSLVGGLLQRDQTLMWSYGHCTYDGATMAGYRSVAGFLNSKLAYYQYGPDSLLFV